jgi:dTMP kinase
MKKRTKQKGMLIVIDGADGSGKATQTELLIKRLRKEGYKTKTIDFPRYYNNFFGKFIGQCLAGEYGDFIALDPHIASVLYAADRFESKKDIEKWLKQGYVVVADRYVSANQMHQGGKIQDSKKRKQFLDWLDELEFGVFGLPRPDMIVYLDVPLEVSQKLLAGQQNGVKKRYLKGKKDLAENNAKHLEDSRKSALKLVQKNNQWARIQCTRKGELLSREAVAVEVWKQVSEIIK